MIEILKNILINPWTVTIVGGLFVGIIIERIFKHKKNMKVGIHATKNSKNTKIINCKSSRPDGGLLNESKNLLAVNSEFEATGKKK